MAQKRTVTEFLRKIRKEYNSARETYTELNDKISFYEGERERKLRECKDFSKHQDIRAKYANLIIEVERQIQELIKSSYANFEQIRNESESVFGKHNHPEAEKIDIPTVELLKSGILKDNEFEALEKRFASNCAMLRIIGKYAYEHGEKTGNAELRSVGSRLQNWQFPYREHINELVELSRMGLRVNRVLSDRIGKIYDGRADKIFTAAEGICVDVEE